MERYIKGSKEESCKPLVRGDISRIYIIAGYKDEYYIVYDPGYELGSIHIYRQVESISLDTLRKEFKETKDRRYLVRSFIKKRFIKEPDLEYEICECD
jgi:hypothetical protein